MSSSYTHYSDISVNGKVSSSKQGILIGTATVEPGSSGGPQASECNGMTLLYNGNFYTSNGTTWVKQEIGSNITKLSQLEDDATHRLVTDTDKSNWNAKQDALTPGTDYVVPESGKGLFSGNYNDLSNKPTIPTIPDITKATTGSGNVVSDITVNGHTITLNKGVTALTEHQDISGLAPKASPELTGTPTAPTAASGTNTTQIATTAFVKNAIDGIPTPMRFMGTVGTGGTITSLPAASTSNNGYVYKAISAGTSPVTYAIGDTLVSNGTVWTVIPSGDEPSGTVTNVATGTGLTGGPITSSGTISLATSGATAGSYGDSAAQTPGYGGKFKVPYVTVDAYGRVTNISAHDVTIPASDNVDTKNTAGATDNSNKMFLIGATAQGANPQTYSNTKVYATNGALVAESFNGKTFTATAPTSTSTDSDIPTSKAVYSAINDVLTTVFGGSY